MAPFSQIDPDGVAGKAADYWRVPIGAASPLWAAYAGMAGAGIAYWWMSQWLKPVNLEALALKLPMVPETVPAPEVMAEALAALQPEPVAPPVEPAVAPEEPAAKLAEVGNAMAAEVAEAVGEAAMVVSFTADDLTRLVGIGPTLAAKLSDLGVRTFADIASWSEEDLERFDKTLDLKGRAMREAWVDQARQFTAQN